MTVDLFTLPEPHIGETAARIMSLRDGNAKMSKSDPSDMSRINLDDDDDAIAQKIRKAKTDAEPLPELRRRCGPARGAQPRHHLRRAHRPHAAIGARGIRRPGLRRVQAGAGRPAGRDARADPRSDSKHFEADPAELDAILPQGAAKAAELAAPTLEGAYRALGLPR